MKNTLIITINYRYLEQSIVTLLSVLEFNKFDYIKVYCIGFIEEEMQNIINRYTCIPMFKDVELIPFDSIHLDKKINDWTYGYADLVATRIKIFDELSKCDTDTVYTLLDVDIVVKGSLKDVYNICAKTKCDLIGVEEVDVFKRWHDCGSTKVLTIPYLNAGFLVVKKINKGIFKRFQDWFVKYHNDTTCIEQDFLNYEYNYNKQPIIPIYNFLHWNAKFYCYNYSDVIVFHYAGTEKPFNFTNVLEHLPLCFYVEFVNKYKEYLSEHFVKKVNLNWQLEQQNKCVINNVIHDKSQIKVM